MPLSAPTSLAKTLEFGLLGVTLNPPGNNFSVQNLPMPLLSLAEAKLPHFAGDTPIAPLLAPPAVGLMTLTLRATCPSWCGKLWQMAPLGTTILVPCEAPRVPLGWFPTTECPRTTQSWDTQKVVLPLLREGGIQKILEAIFDSHND